MGIDIRDGAQLECIQCGLCIDACNEIMDKVGRPSNLIAYDTIANQEAAVKHTTSRPKIFRARTLVYFGLITLVSAIMLWALSQRSLLEANVLADRNPYYVRLSNGDIRNGFTLKILNKLHEPHRFTISVEGIKNATLKMGEANMGETPIISVPTDVMNEFRTFVFVPKDVAMTLSKHGHPFTFIVRDVDTGRLTRRTATFRRPPK